MMLKYDRIKQAQNSNKTSIQSFLARISLNSLNIKWQQCKIIQAKIRPV